MVAITNYATLLKAVQDESANIGTEFTSFIPTAIAMAEEKLFRELDLPQLEAELTGNLAIGTQTIVKPVGHRFTDYLIVKIGNKKTVLKKKFKSFLEDYWPDSTMMGEPKYYADNTATQLIVAPTPDTAYSYTLRYSKEPTRLSTANPTNFFVERTPTILFYAVMIEMARFMKAWTQVPVWEASYGRTQEGWNAEAMRYRRDGNITPNSPDDGPNSLKHTITTQA